MTINFSTLQLSGMQVADLDDVMAVELAVYSHPWSKNSFIDSLINHYEAWVVRTDVGELLGYFVHIVVLDESHLLTIAVKESMQGKGMGVFLLKLVVQQAMQMELNAVLLEVRVSNSRAIKLYESFGFTRIGRRKNYYQIDQQQREDALILQYQITK